MDNFPEKIGILFLGLICLLSFLPIGRTISYFNDSEILSAQILTGFWEIPSPTSTPFPSESPASFPSDTPTPEPSPSPVIGRITINEFLPRPSGPVFGDDSDSMPMGEWVELYSTYNQPFDLAGFYITDDGSHRIDVEACRTDTGGTIIQSNGFIVVYRKASELCNSHNFSLNNEGDTVNLYDPMDILIDSHAYIGDDVAPNKSIARIPDGSDNWVDPFPTPGKPNVLEEPASINNVSPPEIVELGPLSIPASPSEQPLLPLSVELPDTSTPDPEPSSTPIPTPELIETSLPPALTEMLLPSEQPTPTPEPIPEVISESTYQGS